MDGSVMFHNNYELCFEESIDWSDILTGEGADVSFKDDGGGVARECEFHTFTYFFFVCWYCYLDIKYCCGVTF